MTVMLWMLFGAWGTVFLIYGRGVSYPFVYDDHWTILKNPAIQTIYPLARFFLDKETVALPASGMGRTIYRPLPSLTFAMDRALGLSAKRMRVENYLLHGLNGFLVFVWLGILGFSGPASAVGSAFFLFHPAEVESTLWITQRSNLMVSTGILCALLAFAFSPRRRPIMGIMAFGAALLCKETALLFPILWTAQEWSLRRKNAAVKNEKIKHFAVACLAVTLGYLILRHLVVGTPIQRTYRGGGMIGSLLLGTVSWWEYLKILIWPVSLRVSYWQYVDDPFRSVWPWIGLLTACAYGTATILIARSDRRAAFFLAWIPVTLALVLGIFPTDTFVAERFLYVPLIGVAGIVAWTWDQSRSWTRGTFARSGIFIALGLLCLLTWRQSGVWKDELTLWTNATQRDPRNGFARLCQAQSHQDLGRQEDAVKEYLEALRIGLTRTQAAGALCNLSRLQLGKGNPSEALAWSEKALLAAPGSPPALFNKEQALRQLGRFSEADDTRRRVLEH